jgi:hypothetical protein
VNYWAFFQLVSAVYPRDCADLTDDEMRFAWIPFVHRGRAQGAFLAGAGPADVELAAHLVLHYRLRRRP